MASARICSGSLARRLVTIGIAAVSATACAHLGAPGPVVADRPGFTDTPVAIPARAMQLEMGLTNDQTGDDGIVTSTLSTGEVLLRLGVGARAELRLFGNSYDVRSGGGSPTIRGLEDFKYGAKLNVRSVADSVHSWLPNAALLAAATTPSGAGGFSAGAAQAEAKLAMSWTTPSPFSLYANVGYTSGFIGFSRQGKGWTSAAGWWAVNPRVSLFAEGFVFAQLGDENGAHGGTIGDAGATYLVNDRLQVDVRAGHGFVGVNSTERFIGIGLARRW